MDGQILFLTLFTAVIYINIYNYIHICILHFKYVYLQCTYELGAVSILPMRKN